LTAALTPPFIAYVRQMKLGQAVREEGPRSHLSKEGTPTMGGVVILVAIVAAALVTLWRLGARDNLLEIGVDAKSLLPLAPLVAFGLLGCADDLLKARKGQSLGVAMWPKLAVQFGISAVFLAVIYNLEIASGGSRFDTSVSAFGRTWVLGWLYWPFAAVLMVGMSNAVNIADGLDGLVAGLVAIAATALMAVPVLPVNAHVPIVLAAAAGACLAFLWFNANPASIFMGDTGSLALGGLLAAVAIQGKQEIPLIIIGAVFVAEAGTVAVQVAYFKYTKRRYGEGRRIWKMTPLHHHYELSGWPEQKVVVRFWIAAIVFAMLGILSSRGWHTGIS